MDPDFNGFHNPIGTTEAIQLQTRAAAPTSTQPGSSVVMGGRVDLGFQLLRVLLVIPHLDGQMGATRGDAP